MSEAFQDHVYRERITQLIHKMNHETGAYTEQELIDLFLIPEMIDDANLKRIRREARRQKKFEREMAQP